jgi:hypothetical protein
VEKEHCFTFAAFNAPDSAPEGFRQMVFLKNFGHGAGQIFPAAHQQENMVTHLTDQIYVVTGHHEGGAVTGHFCLKRL